MVGRGDLELGFRGAVAIVVVVPLFLWFVRRRWRLEAARGEEVRRLAFLAAAEEQRAEMEAAMAYLNAREPAPAATWREPPSDAWRAPPVAAREVAAPVVAMECAFCFGPATARCAKCKAVRYCSGKCQIAHWRQGHKAECQPPSASEINNGRSTMSNSQGEQAVQIGTTDRDLEVEEARPAQAVQTSPEPSVVSVSASVLDTLDGDSRPKENSKNAPETRSISSRIASSGPKSSGVSSTVVPQAPSVTDESIVHDTSLGHPSSSHTSSINQVSEIDGSWLDPESTSTYSAVNNTPNLKYLNQTVSVPTVEAVEGLSSEHQPKETGEDKVVDSVGFKARSVVVGTSDLKLRTQNPPIVSASAESKSQPKHEKAKSSSQEKNGSAVNSMTNNVELGILRSKTHSHASSAGQVSSDSESASAESKSQPKHEKTNSSSKEKNSSAVNSMTNNVELGILRSKTHALASSASRISYDSGGDAFVVSRPSQMDNTSTALKKSTDGKCSVANGMITSKSVVKHSTIPKTLSHYQSGIMLFPYDLFIKLYNYNIVELNPCGLTNIGNSCYANAVLQCLAFTRPLTAYLLEGFHSKKCRKREWCFTCKFESLVIDVKKGKSPLSPSSILSHLDDIGGNFGQGRQEDAHEFLRFVVDAMQSICLKEAGAKLDGEKLAEETTLIQQTFGGFLQSKIKCSKCKSKSERCERMMDLTVDIHGDVDTLEEALSRFTSDEILDGENKYECDKCKSYERAKKKLTISEAPNILVIVLKRFQSGKFGKLNKTVRFPEYLDLAPYMSSMDDKSPIYRLYAVVVHIDVQNSSLSGHYVCYVKDTRGRWYNIDDSKVRPVEIQQVLLESAYMLLYARCLPHAPSLVRKAMVYEPTKLRRIKSKDYTNKQIPLPRHPSVPATSINSCNFQSTDLFDDRIRPFMNGGYSSDNSSLFSHSDEGSCSTDSTRDSTSTEEHWENFSSGSSYGNSEKSDELINSPSASSQSLDTTATGRKSNLSSSRGFISDASSSGRDVDTDTERFGVTNFIDKAHYNPFDREGRPSFLYSDNSKQYKNLTEHRTVEADFSSSNEVNSGVLFRRTRERSTQPFY